MKKKLREFLQPIVYSLHKTLFYVHYKKVTELLVPNLFRIEKIKLGREGDGTYILPSGLINNDNVLLSLGIADDISFEEDFIKIYPNTTVLAFDPSIPQLPGHNEKIIFHCKGVAGRDFPKRNLITFDSIIRENKIEKQIIIKMDIEGWEWGIFDKLNFDDYNIPVIVIEFHMMTLNTKAEWILFPYYFWRRLTILKKILRNYYVFHLHANNHGYTYFKCFTFPWLFEMTLIKKELFFDEIKKDIDSLNSLNYKERKDVQYPFLK
jgi:hypothetical protein